MGTSVAEDVAARILYVEDNEDDLIAVSNLLDAREIQISWSANLANARKFLMDDEFDLILLDHVLPDGNGLSFIEEVWWNYPDIPLILITGRNDESLALSAIHKGAVNFVLKDEIYSDLPQAVESALGRRLNLKQREHFVNDWQVPDIQTEHLTPWLEPYHPPTDEPADRFLNRAQEFYREVLSTMTEPVVVVDADGVITYANDAVSRFLGIDEKHLLGGGLDELFEEETERKLFELRSELKTHRAPTSFSIPGRCRSRGSGLAHPLPVWISSRSLHDKEGTYRACLMNIAVLKKQAP